MVIVVCNYLFCSWIIKVIKFFFFFYYQDLQYYYNGFVYVVEVIGWSFLSNQDKVLILDVVVGIGLVGEEVSYN